MSLSTVLLIVPVLMRVAVVLHWRRRSGRGYGPSRLPGLVLTALPVMALTGRV